MRPEPTAARVVSSDPFWGVVRRRHPDIDIVLLPRAAGVVSTGSPNVPVEDPVGVARRRDAEASALWQRLVGHQVAGSASRWASGSAGGVRRESTMRLEGIDQVAGVDIVERATETLRRDGWHVFVPPAGLTRVMAGRDEATGRTELQLVNDPGRAALVLRVRSAAHHVGREAVHALLGGES